MIFFPSLSSFQFDSYIRSLSIDPSSPTVRLVTDGQLPLRQCLHPEACTKDIKLPAYYWRFSDLRKEFARCRSGDVSQALVAINDAKKNTPTAQLPNSILEMFTGEQSFQKIENGIIWKYKITLFLQALVIFGTLLVTC